MLTGELYIAADPHLGALHLRKRRLVQAINTSRYDAFEERSQLFHELFGALGEDASIEPPFQCDYGCNTYIGDHFYANVDCAFLDVAEIRIGDNVFMGPRVSLYTPYHPIDAGVRNQQLEGGRPITIGDDVWFGGSVTVCPGVTIGNDVVVGAGSVVTKDVPDHSVVAGNPARVLRAITADDRVHWQAKAAEYRAWKAAAQA
ncbi:MAG: sugar O-acetyltransferase [Bifidobacterium sp.]|nr:sugar O-acetyltransferase [Bifidobacterium sp.]